MPRYYRSYRGDNLADKYKRRQSGNRFYSVSSTLAEIKKHLYGGVGLCVTCSREWNNTEGGYDTVFTVKKVS